MKDLCCKELVQFLDDYIDGHQPDDVRATFERHIEKCPPCRDFVNMYRDTIRVTQSICDKGDHVPCEVPEQLISAILDARKQCDQ